MNFTLKLSFFFCLAIAFINQTVSIPPTLVPGSTDLVPLKLDYDFYSISCPSVDNIIRSTFKELYKDNHNIAPALIRMLFHDCFVHGCDASVLLDSADGMRTEKHEPQNESLRLFEVVDAIKSRLEEKCPGVVCCADILALAARESVFAVGGPYYPLNTGRRDSTNSFPNGTSDLPSPFDNRRDAVASFASKGFSEQELVTLLGAHSTGEVHCKFIRSRLENFNSTGRPDPSIDPEFLETLRAKCNGSDIPSMRMDFEGIGANFGTLYYRSLLQRKGLTFLDQQMTSGEETGRIVDAYASEASQFQFYNEFVDAMTKLSNLQVLTAPMGQIRHNCRRVNSPT